MVESGKGLSYSKNYCSFLEKLVRLYKGNYATAIYNKSLIKIVAEVVYVMK